MWGKHLLSQPEYAYACMHNAHTYIYKYTSLHMRTYVFAEGKLENSIFPKICIGILSQNLG